MKDKELVKSEDRVKTVQEMIKINLQEQFAVQKITDKAKLT